MSDAPLSERVERSPAAQIVISVLIVLVVLAEIGTHLPSGSALHAEVNDQASWFTRAAATEMQWGVFAPDPRQTSLRIEGRVTFEDGSTAVWELPEGPRIGGNLRYYRWRKWLERVRSDDYRDLYEPTARWIAGLYDGGPSPVASVELVRFFHKNELVGDPPDYEEFVYWTYRPGDGAA